LFATVHVQASAPSWPGSLSLGDGGLSGDSIQRLQEAFTTIRENREIQKLLKTNGQEITLLQRISEGGWETTKFQGYFKGLEVVGSMALHHRGPWSWDITNALARFNLSVAPTLTAEDAARIAQETTGASENDLKILTAPELKILPDESSDSAQLIYWVAINGTNEAAGHDVLVNAHTGAVLADVSRWQTAGIPAQVHVLAANSRCQKFDPAGNLTAYDPTLCSLVIQNGRTLPGADRSAGNALSNSASVLRYFATTHGRNSFDNRGTALVSIVHMGQKFPNAFWDSERNIMAYGDGDGVELGDMTQAMDVAGHEMTHGVTSLTAKLQYFGESGAINEAMSDIFGKLIANDGDWVLGRKLFLRPSANSGIRNLANPRLITFKYQDATGRQQSRGYPATVAERLPSQQKCDDSNDRCWVHINATIFGHGAYRVIKRVGKERAEKMYYRALTQLMTPRTGFLAGGQAVLKACGQLFGATSTTCSATQLSLSEVGLVSR